MELLNALIGHMAVWPIAFSVAGVAIGIAFGAIPGLNQGVVMALTLPLTFHMDSYFAQVLLIGMYVGGVSGSMVTGVTLGIPGSPASIMTTFDGHAMAKRGMAAKALALGVTASFIGGLISWICLSVVSEPIARFSLRNFGSFEYAALVFGGLLIIATCSGRNFAMGLTSGLLGMFFALVGLDLVSQVPRFTFGFERLDSGFRIEAVLVGLFAIGHLLFDVQTGSKNAEQIPVRTIEIIRQVKGVSRHWINLIRSSLIGAWIGILPGIGANIGSVVSYYVTRNIDRDPQSFGTGREEGIVASESGNNATVGGALIPMISMGIPGSGADVILMAALLFHNIQPGPLLVLEHPETFYGIIATYLVATVGAFVLLVSLAVWLARVVAVPRAILVPAIFILAVAGTYSLNNLFFDVWVMLGFGLFGFLMRVVGLPSAPFMIGFVLTPLFEEKFRASMMETGGSLAPYFERPITFLILVFSVIFALAPTVLGRLRANKNEVRNHTG
ncbi:tripartite tricarboxylate transporter permease [Sulfitobacter mediterraneus]|uniref:tripartite tricarboxylate transporter permease n=1 Tax=Sulfitobacter mediterraneus TaxID=83219 RepID=UPI0021A80896|nr:tripartite tricarboxylate transporter permease [Sulfitobacter mediterraneus]UWR13332.1 tripartite tricarboxylate transporter permease [Sulfitobacter mediterraneus]